MSLGVRSMDELTPTERVLTAGYAGRVERLDRIAQSTPEANGPAHEASLAELCRLHIALHERTVVYLSRGGTPGNETRSGAVRSADDVYSGALQAVAAAFGQLYPGDTDAPPITELKALVLHRVGPLCSGWEGPRGHLVHHPALPCDVHTDHEVPGA